MKLLTIFGRFAQTITATAAGVWLGAMVRSRITGDPPQALRFRYTDADGASYSNIPVTTKFYPALLMALLGKPRWAFAFAGGVLFGALMPERVEVAVIGRIMKLTGAH